MKATEISPKAKGEIENMLRVTAGNHGPYFIWFLESDCRVFDKWVDNVPTSIFIIFPALKKCIRKIIVSVIKVSE